MIALYDFIPRYCPYCGQAAAATSDPASVADFSGRFSFRCAHCNLVYQKAHTRQLMRLARESGGDLHRDLPPIDKQQDGGRELQSNFQGPG
jgi:Zn-finger protein